MKARPEIAVRQVLQVNEELLREWQIKPIDVAQVFGDRRIERTLGVERSARRKAHQEKRQRDDDEQSRHGGKNAGERAPEHASDGSPIGEPFVGVINRVPCEGTPSRNSVGVGVF